MSDWAVWAAITAILDIALASGVTVHAVLWKRDSRSVIAWVGLAWLAPILGSCAYLILGINRVYRKASSLRSSDPPDLTREPQLSQAHRHETEVFAAAHPGFVGLANAGARLTGLPLLAGNRVEPLVNGDQAYPAMLDAIRRARRSVSLLTYLFDSDRAGESFLEALSDAQGRGVAVRVLIDDVGSQNRWASMVSRLQEAGVTAASFLPTRIPRLPTTANLRNHRKILVVDGVVGFTGGTNIWEGHWLALEPREPAQCLHFKLEGPVVHQVQRVFAADWAFAVDEELRGDDWFPPAARAGDVWARGVEHGPDENFEKLVDVLASALASARRRVRIVTPYFLPQAALVAALNVTALRGVDVEIHLPSVNDVPLVHWAATAQLWQVLEKGCRVFSTPPPFDHTKLMTVDDCWTLLGSTNWDPRSLRLNFEFNVECYSEDLVSSLNPIIDEKARSGREITLAEVNARSFPARLRDGLARLLTPYL